MTEASAIGQVLTGRILSFVGDPLTDSDAVLFHNKGAIAINRDGRIAYAGAAAGLPSAYADWPRDDHGHRILTAGFVDPHIHFPQFRMVAAPGRDLLDWLERFTFPEEARFADGDHAALSAEIFLDRMIAHGTTAAVAYSSSHKGATEALFRAAERRGMAIAAGKTMMDRNAPDAVRDEAEQSGIDSADLISRWHGRGRALYAITPRFAITSTEAQLGVAGDLLKAHPTCLMQTHLSESHREIETVKRLFPNDRDYTAVYERFGLLGPTSLFGHGIHLSDDECRRLAESGSTVVHCPTSNTFLGSGLFDIDHVGRPDRAVGIGLATDIGGGTSYSMLTTMGEAYKVAMLGGRRVSATRLFYLATLGNATRMGLASSIGSLAPGKIADIISLDPRATEGLAARDDLSETLEDRLFALTILGDDRAVAGVWIQGRRALR